MAALGDDVLLRTELEEFGKEVGKINDKTRPIYIKLLNHCKAQRDKALKTNDRQKKSSGRSIRQSMVNVQPKSDEYDGLNDEKNDDVYERHLRRRTINIARPSNVNGDYSEGKTRKNRSPPRSPSRSQKPTLFSTPAPVEEVTKLRPLENFSSHPSPDSYIARRLISAEANAGQTPPRNSGLLSNFFGSQTRENPDSYRLHASKTKVERPLTEFSDSEEEFVPDMTSKAINTSFPPDDSYARYSPSKFGSHLRQPESKIILERHHTFHPSKVPYTTFPNFLSKVIPLGITGFFLTVIMVYIYKAFIVTPMPSAFISQDKFCMKLDDNEICLNDKERAALDDIIIILAQRQGEIFCGIIRKESPDGFVVVSELTNLLGQKHEDVGRGNGYEVNVDNLLIFIQNRQDWNIRMKCKDPDNPTVFSQECEKSVVSNLVSLRSERKMLPLTCRVRRALSYVTWKIIYGLLAITGTVGATLLVIWMKKRRDRTMREINFLANEIVRLLQNHASHCRSDPNLKPYLPVSHIRDALIPLSERAKKTYIWNEAVKQLGENETRIIEEIQDISGEDTAVWRWSELTIDLLATKPSLEESSVTKDSPKPSQALKYSFTPEMKRLNLLPFDSKLMSSCLKVFNILPHHTPDNYISVELRDAILDKCGQYHGILHIGCDFKIEEGVVFIKCISESAAHQNYKALHGWVYDDRLVSVKYVSPVVYKMIFADSEEAMVTLKSSAHRRRT